MDLRVRSYDALHAGLAPERDALLAHPIYARVRDLSSLRTFMAAHAFAVWDFMSLLKSLQRRVTCVEVPWAPPRSRTAARLVNTLVLAEESDEVSPGRLTSHYELYIDAMLELGADAAPVTRFVEAISRGLPLPAAFEAASAPPHVVRFVRATLDFASAEPDEVPAAAFLVGREDLVPEMFRRLREEAIRAGAAASFRLYLERHIEVDEGEHGPLARRLLAELCHDDESSWRRAVDAGRAALTARHQLWDGVLASLP